MRATRFLDRRLLEDEYDRIRDQGRLLELREICAARLQLAKANSSPNTKAVFYALADLSGANYDYGDFDAAACYLTEAIRADRVWCRDLVAEHAYYLIKLAYLYTRTNRLSEAELAYEAAQSLLDKVGLPKNLLESTQFHCLSQIQWLRGDLHSALKSLSKSMQIRWTEFDPTDPRIVTPYYELARLLWRMGNDRAAMRCAEKAYWMHECRRQFDSVIFCEFMGFMALLKAKEGRLEDAATLFERSLRKLRKLRPPCHPQRIEIEAWSSTWLHSGLSGTADCKS